MLLALYGMGDAHGHGNLHVDAHATVVGLSLGKTERRRGESAEELMLTLDNGKDVLLPLTDSEELLEYDICGKRHVGDMDVVITGCEGEDRSITIGGHGSWEYTAETNEFRRVSIDDDTCDSTYPPEADQDAVAMVNAANDMVAEGESFETATDQLVEYD